MLNTIKCEFNYLVGDYSDLKYRTCYIRQNSQENIVIMNIFIRKILIKLSFSAFVNISARACYKMEMVQNV